MQFYIFKELQRVERERFVILRSKSFCFFFIVNDIILLLNCRIRTKTVLAARADAERIKLIGGAEASSIEAIGKAEAESMRQKAAAYKQYGDAALMSLVLESLPKVCGCFIKLRIFVLRSQHNRYGST